MSKKAEERALETYPDPEFDGYFDDIYVIKQGQAARNRSRYIEGYEQAEKDLIERACKWILGNLATYFGHSPVYQQDMINDFREAMEEEL